MKQAKKYISKFIAGTAIALLSLCLTFYPTQASSPPDVPDVNSTIMGFDNDCEVYTVYGCIVVGICCGNSAQILNGDIKDVQQDWMLDFWNGEMIIRFRQMADQWTEVITLQAAMIGGFFDAQVLTSTQTSLQRLQAESSRKYITDQTICQFGTVSRSLAATEALGQRNKIIIAERAQNRQVLNLNSNAANTVAKGREPGRASDKAGRLTNFITTFCNNIDENFVMDSLCQGATHNQQFNRDIDYARTFDLPMTLDVNFNGAGTATRDQTNLFALNSNLYANNILANRPNPDSLDSDAKGNDVQKWMDYRSVVAKRSIAQNSFASIASMKTTGTNGSYNYLRAIMQNLGMSANDIQSYLGTANPSYYAQMEILTRRIYQNPDFYSNLMKSPANVLRTQASLTAIGLMQERDIADSMQRSEMLLSTLLEIQTLRAQEQITDRAAR